MKKIITKALCTIFFAGLVVTLILNLGLQVLRDKRDFRTLSGEYFWQIENVIAENDQKLERVKEEFAQSCILRAKMAAYIVAQNPEMIENQWKSKRVASLLQVDELHFFDTEGIIFAGTNPEYYGLGMDAGEQIGFFKPMLTDTSLELCQDITPNTAEEKKMQYAAAWCTQENIIVQVGLNPERVLKEIKGNNISDVFEMISCEQNTTFYAVDAVTGEILGSTDMEDVGKAATEIGLDVMEVSEELASDYQQICGEKQYYVAKRSGSLILVQCCPTCELFRGVLGDMLQLCLYFFLLFLALMAASYVFLERKIIRSILNINEKLKKIEQGNWNVTLEDNSTEEFAQLCSYINSMVGSLLSFSGKISKALEMSEIPIGICEYEIDKKRMTATSRVKDILRLTDEEYEAFLKHPEQITAKEAGYFYKEKNLAPHVYGINGHKGHYIRIEVFNYEQSRIVVLIDVTADIREKREIAIERDTDLLTGLYNRRAFFRKMEEVYEKPLEGQNAVLFMFDLDHLKMVNDAYGHQDGDRYITAFAEVLHRCRGEQVITARMGGDEFILFYYGLKNEEEAEKIASWLRTFQNRQKVVMTNGEEITLEFSMGYSLSSGEEDYYTLVRKADERMYEDKKKRREK